MNNSKASDHPWRTRTREFQNFLQAQSKEDQRRLKAAEQRFLAHRSDAASRQMRATRDFVESLVGAREVVDSD